jgi:UDPglucose--hexose-1-phosphate uridylyltransferase
MSIELKKIEEKMRFMNPFKDFSLDEIPIEIRYDPFTGQTSRIFNLPYKPIERPDFERLIERSKQVDCPFCPEAIEKSTTLYPKEIIPEGRVRVGEACLFPNLLPLDRYTGVCVMSGRHFVAIHEFTPEIMKDAFLAALSFIRQVADRDPNVRFFNINWNYMSPAGSSIIHPHLQVNSGIIPTRQIRLLTETSHTYFLKNGRTFWEDYMALERGMDERYLKDIGSTFWTMSFAPQGALPDISFIFHDSSSMLQLEEKDLDSFLRGLASAIGYIDKQGLYSFNVSIFSGRENDHFRVNGRVTPRFLLREIGNSDQTYYQVLHREPCSMKSPESVKNEALEFFRS